MVLPGGCAAGNIEIVAPGVNAAAAVGGVDEPLLPPPPPPPALGGVEGLLLKFVGMRVGG